VRYGWKIALPRPLSLHRAWVQGVLQAVAEEVGIGAFQISSWALVSMLPQLATGGWMPRPRKLSTDSNRITLPIDRVISPVHSITRLGLKY
jgi:hypothetical protein